MVREVAAPGSVWTRRALLRPTTSAKTAAAKASTGASPSREAMLQLHPEEPSEPLPAPPPPELVDDVPVADDPDAAVPLLPVPVAPATPVDPDTPTEVVPAAVLEPLVVPAEHVGGPSTIVQWPEVTHEGQPALTAQA